MRRQAILTVVSLLSGTALFAACGRATSGTCEESDDCTADGSVVTDAEQDGGAFPDAGNDGTGVPLDDAGEDATATEDAGDAATIGNDASDASDAEVKDAGPPLDASGCATGQKNCGGSCVAIDDPDYGCTATTCTACAASNATQYTCNGTTCAPTTCATSYHLCNAACDPNSDLPTQDSCEISETYGVFVSSSLGAAGNPGTRAAPLKTIQAAITLAASTGKRVYACAEAYSEADTLSSNVSIFGYFTCTGGTWAVGSGQAVVTSPTSPAVAATNVTGVAIYNVSWTAPNQAANSSASSYGMFATGSTLTLTDVTLTAGAGGSGSSGGLGPAPVVASVCPASTGAAAGPGTNGGTTKLSYSSAGAAVATGGSGSAGPNGQDGTAGGAGQCTYNSTVCSFSSVDDQCVSNEIPVCANNGSAGCGGPGGAAGGGGGGGGSSIALFGWASNISAGGGQLASGTAGSGGSGVDGATAPPPSSLPTCTGAVGGNEAVSVHGCEGSSSSTCKVDPTPESVPLTGGTAGGNGGAGGTGGNGAGGGGGDSYSYYRGGGAMLTIGAGVALTFGAPGGAGGGPIPGNAGNAATYNTLD